MIVATAGHVDHGKTTLVAALTGVDTDRLPEEKARGMSIELGYAFHDLGDGAPTGFIDVPGHERFVRTMVAGVAGTDVVLFVVAADDGPMPQTAEHLAILDLLGIAHGIVALSKCDRADAARCAEVTAAIRGLLAGTTLADCPILPVSAQTGQGIEALRAALLAMKRALPPRASGGNFRLAVDRSFVLKGVGRVVTGTVFAGSTRVGDTLHAEPGGSELRVRAIHTQNEIAEHARSGLRCALKLGAVGRSEAEIARGDWIVAPGAAFATQRLDAELRLLPGETTALRSRTAVHLHLGAAHALARVLPLDRTAIAPGEQALVQLQLDAPLHAVRGDRYVLRDPSAQRTIGGGSVIHPLPEETRRRRADRLRSVEALRSPRLEDALAALLRASPEGVDLARCAQAWNLTAEEANALFERVPMTRYGTAPALMALDPARWQALLEATTGALAQLHRDLPEREGHGRAELRAALTRGLGATLPLPLFRAVLEAAIAQGLVLRVDGLHRLPAHVARRDPADERMWLRLRPLFEVPDDEIPVVSHLVAALKTTAPVLEAYLAKFARQGLLVRVSDKRYFLPATIDRLAQLAVELAAERPDGRFGPAEFRDRSGIGRNAVIDVLEHFDRMGLTRREGNQRRVLHRAR
ncbi:MAG TPA: selenocysteine-specific translation elongation factor [Gammaproteobacteria bacterium]|nr:selenocysteine-specific translation elongation factor [Gammaproteobacteria bacterium]